MCWVPEFVVRVRRVRWVKPVRNTGRESHPLRQTQFADFLNVLGLRRERVSLYQPLSGSAITAALKPSRHGGEGPRDILARHSGDAARHHQQAPIGPSRAAENMTCSAKRKLRRVIERSRSRPDELGITPATKRLDLTRTLQCTCFYRRRAIVVDTRGNTRAGFPLPAV
jgi:hypothetical protein